MQLKIVVSLAAQLNALRGLMKEVSIDAYYVPSEDAHQVCPLNAPL